MSIASQIDRINGEVSSQSTIIDEISTILDGKCIEESNLNIVKVRWTLNDDGSVKYTDNNNISQGVSTNLSNDDYILNDVNIEKGIIINTSTRITSGYEITIKVVDGVIDINLYDKGFGPTA